MGIQVSKAAAAANGKREGEGLPATPRKRPPDPVLYGGAAVPQWDLRSGPSGDRRSRERPGQQRGCLGSRSVSPELAWQVTSNEAPEAKRKPEPGGLQAQELTKKASLLAKAIGTQQETRKRREMDPILHRGPFASSRRCYFHWENPWKPSGLFSPRAAACRSRCRDSRPPFSTGGSPAQGREAGQEPRKAGSLSASPPLAKTFPPAGPSSSSPRGPLPSGRGAPSRRGNLRGLPGRRRSPCLGHGGSGRPILGRRPRGSSSAGL